MPLAWDITPKPRAFRLEALALIESGQSARSVARQMGFSEKNVPVWRRDASLIADAKTIGAALKAQARARREHAAAVKAAAYAARRIKRDHHNRPILHLLENTNARDAQVVRFVLADHTLQEAGQRFGITRERARQIVAKAVARYGLDTEGRFFGKPPLTSAEDTARRKERRLKLAEQSA